VASIVAAVVMCIFLTVFTPAEFCSFVQFSPAASSLAEEGSAAACAKSSIAADNPPEIAKARAASARATNALGGDYSFGLMSSLNGG